MHCIISTVVVVFETRRALGGAQRMYLRQSCSDGLRWIKPCVAAVTCTCTNTYWWDFPDIIKFRIAAHTISEKATLFRYPDYNPDRALKLISSPMSRHLSTRNISSKSMQAFLSNLSHIQTDKRTRAKTYTSSGRAGKNLGFLEFFNRFFRF